MIRTRSSSFPRAEAACSSPPAACSERKPRNSRSVHTFRSAAFSACRQKLLRFFWADSPWSVAPKIAQRSESSTRYQRKTGSWIRLDWNRHSSSLLITFRTLFPITLSCSEAASKACQKGISLPVFIRRIALSSSSEKSKGGLTSTVSRGRS